MRVSFPVRSLLLVVLACTALVLLASCTDTSSQRADSRVVEEQQSIYNRVQPVPVFDWSQDRDTLIQIYTQKNQALTTYTVFQSNGSGEVRFSCPSIGFALPADTSLTNPLQPIYFTNGPVTVEQPEPNGLFSSKNTDGTYVLCVRPDGSVTPVYTELKVTTYPFAVREENGRLVDAGESSSMQVEVGRGPAAPATLAPSATVTP
jgi:hypothetical protein